MTPQTADEMDRLADDIAGGPEERAMQRIDQLVNDGVLVDRVTWPVVTPSWVRRSMTWTAARVEMVAGAAAPR